MVKYIYCSPHFGNYIVTLHSLMKVNILARPPKCELKNPYTHSFVLEGHNIQSKALHKKAFDTWEQCSEMPNLPGLNNKSVYNFYNFVENQKHHKIKFLDCRTPRRLTVLYSTEFFSHVYEFLCDTLRKGRFSVFNESMSSYELRTGGRLAVHTCKRVTRESYPESWGEIFSHFVSVYLTWGPVTRC